LVTRAVAESELTDEIIRDSDCVIICTEHSGIDYRGICEKAKLIVDTRNALNENVRNGSKATIVRL
jgi:UDP-N-acetyl-D-mannosaminuronate dehydrogenase